MAAVTEEGRLELPEDHQFLVPTKEVKTPEDMKQWEKSEAFLDYLGFIIAVGDAVKGKKARDLDPSSGGDDAKGMLNLLDSLSFWIDEIPPEEQEQRFGNKAFRTWHRRMEENASEMIRKALPSSAAKEGVVDELKVYLLDSFGNATRIDYGTGHEMTFLMLLSCVFRVGDLGKAAGGLECAGLLIFGRYLEVVRKLQIAYRMEPAGSQGVWSLDDFQFVPFIWGAAQLTSNARVKPKSIADYEVAEMLASDYLLFGCIKHISKVKTGPFAEHSNQLWNISAVPTWDKVYSGLLKMYKAEVLSKFPVIQHTYFGSLFTLKQASDFRILRRFETPSGAAGGPVTDRRPPPIAAGMVGTDGAMPPPIFRPT